MLTQTTRWTCPQSWDTCCLWSTSAHPQDPVLHGQWTGSGDDDHPSTSHMEVDNMFTCQCLSYGNIGVYFRNNIKFILTNYINFSSDLALT